VQNAGPHAAPPRARPGTSRRPCNLLLRTGTLAWSSFTSAPSSTGTAGTEASLERRPSEPFEKCSVYTGMTDGRGLRPTLRGWPKTARVLAACCLALCVARPTCAQERAPDGRIYGELLPLVGLNGVRAQVVGMLPGSIGAIYNIRGGPTSPDPAKDVTGLGRPELEQLHREIVEDIADAFRRRGIPLLERGGQSPDVTPRLEVDVSWSRIKPDTVVINVATRLMEAARPIKDTSKIVWAQSWGIGSNGHVSSPDSLAKEIRRVALGGVTVFLELYTRAHATP
jgi:hypothetical protein